jgi:uncharacterized protein YjbI with pentapeptide repeats
MNLKIKSLITALIVPSLVVSPMAVHSQELDQRQLYQLCSRSPFNSRCAGQNIPIPLSARLGESAGCIFMTGNVREASFCKIAQTETGLKLYIETGKPVELLDDQKGTNEVTIESDRIFATNYQIWGKTHRVELGFLTNSDTPTANRTTFLEVLGNEGITTLLKQQLATVPALSPERLSGTLSNSASGNLEILVKQLLETKECVRCNLTSANLSGAKLAEANLEGANLQGANLEGANLEGAYLVGANLDQANLSEINLNHANLTLSSLQGTVLENADMAAVNLQGANAQGADLQGAKLTAPAMLQQINLANANLQNAKLSGAMLANANLESANLQGADLSDTSIRSSGLRGGTSFGQALGDWAVGGLLGVGIGALGRDGVQLVTNLQGANLSRANLTEANLEDALLVDTNFSEANFTNAKLEDTDLTQANLCGATMPDGKRNEQGCASR